MRRSKNGIRNTLRNGTVFRINEPRYLAIANRIYATYTTRKGYLKNGTAIRNMNSNTVAFNIKISILYSFSFAKEKEHLMCSAVLLKMILKLLICSERVSCSADNQDKIVQTYISGKII
jgi:hypothetical protein